MREIEPGFSLDPAVEPSASAALLRRPLSQRIQIRAQAHAVIYDVLDGKGDSFVALWELLGPEAPSGASAEEAIAAMAGDKRDGLLAQGLLRPGDKPTAGAQKRGRAKRNGAAARAVSEALGLDPDDDDDAPNGGGDGRGGAGGGRDDDGAPRQRRGGPALPARVPPGTDTLSAAEAAALLDVKLPTLYVYVSRGLLRSVKSDVGTARRYPREDVMRLKARGDVRAGKPLSAIGALHYGQPVIESAITLIDVDKGPVYRGHIAVDLARAGRSRDDVARLLWGVPDALERGGPPFRSLAPRVPRMRMVEDAETPLAKIETALFFLARQSPRYAVPDETRLAESVLATIDDVVGVGHPVVSVVLADHELNPSTFAARVAASTGAGLVQCLQAAIATFSGPRHGGACDRIEALLDEIGRPGRAREVVKARLARGEEVPGFFSGIYKRVDPRAQAIFEIAEARRSSVVAALIEAMAELGGRDAPGPSSDLALVSLARGLNWPNGTAAAVFAAARLSGWIAHVLEQRRSPDVVRPRARFTGDPPR